MESIVAAVAVDTVDVDIVVVVLSAAAAYHIVAVDAAVNMFADAAVAHLHIFVHLVAAWAVHYHPAMETVVEVVVAAAYTFDEEAAAAVVAKGDNSFDLDLHDSVAAVAAYDVSLAAHLHHPPTANLLRLYSQRTHLDTEAVRYSVSVLLNHLVVSCNDLHCKNVDD